MRFVPSAALAATLLVAAGFAIAGNTPAIRERTEIPAESLGPAIRTLAQERGFQVVYVTGQVEHRRTLGAKGELTTDDALTQVLRGTGLTFYRESDGGVVIELARGRTTATSRLPLQAAAAQSASPPPSDSSFHAAPAGLDQVTIKASRERRALERKVKHFMLSVLALRGNGRSPRWSEVPDRWNVPLCPLVAGLPKSAADLTLVHIFKAAKQAHVRMAGKACHPNLYVVASHHPARLLRKWWARYPRMYVTKFGILPVERFIESRGPVRAWYNTGWWCGSFTAVGWRSFSKPIEPSGPLGFDLPVCRPPSPIPTYGYPWSNISSALVVVDLRRTGGITVRQMADYLALVGLAGIRPDANPGSVPSILHLFRQGASPQGLSVWDRALLYSLYNTSPWAPMQTREIQLTMARRLAQAGITAAPEDSGLRNSTSGTLAARHAF